MRFPRVVVAAIVVATGLVSWRLASTRVTPANLTKSLPTPANAPGPAAGNSPEAAAPRSTGTQPDRLETLARLAYGQLWEGDLPPRMATFREWTQRYTQS